MEKNLFLGLTATVIAVQSFHTYWVIDRYNMLASKFARTLQSSIFCGILGIGIFAFVLIGQHWYALGGAILETLVNWYYYDRYVIPKMIGHKRTESKRDHWVAYMLAIVFPFSIYIFAYWFHQV